MFNKIKAIRNSPLFFYFWGEKGKNLKPALLVLLMNLITALLEGVSFGFLFIALSFLNENGSRSFNSSFLKLLHLNDFLAQRSPMGLFIISILFAIFLQGVRSLASYLGGLQNTHLFIKIQETIQLNLLQKIFRFSFPYANQYKLGDLIEHARSPTVCVTMLMDHVQQMNLNFFMILITLTLMFFLSPILTLVTFAAFALFGFFHKLFIKKIAQESQRFSQFSTDFNQEVVQGLQALRLVHLFNRKDHVLKRVYLYLKDFGISQKKAAQWNNAFSASTEIMGIVTVGAILILGFFVMKERTSSAVAILITFIGLAYRLTFRIQMLIRAIGQVTFSSGSLIRLNNILKEKDKEFVSSLGMPFPGFNHDIVFRSVSFIYPQTTNPVIQDISFAIPSGKTVAFVGSSGAGKSTVLDLLLRLYDPTKGLIEIDGVPLQNYEINEWRKKIGVVTQDIFVFNDTISANILFGDLEASQQDVIDAAIAAGAHSFIEKLPNGYNTVVGERGYRLSGGERQRIALARSLIRKPKLLILDEATSSLDTYSEKIIQETIDSLKDKVTIIIVAHRLSTIVHADQIFVIEKGSILESGTHQELLDKDGRYAYLWKLQSQKLKLKQLIEENENSLKMMLD